MDNNSFEALLKSREEIWSNILSRNKIESIGSLSDCALSKYVELGYTKVAEIY